MLTTAQLRQAAVRSGARDIGIIEVDVMLTHLLQLFHERGLTEHLAFKGGTFLRKMIFGPRGRLSTDLDFTCRTAITLDDLTLGILDALNQPYRGLSFRFDRARDWYLTDDGCAANPVLVHADNPTGVRIKIQVSIRERPVRAVTGTPQLDQGYFQQLDFSPAAIPSLALEEVISEKIRAASQRSKIRDLHDLSEVARKPLRRDLVRALAVLKLWHSTGPGLDFERFRSRIESGRDYDLNDLRNLLRKDQNPDLAGMIGRVIENFQFLGQMSETERALAADLPRRLKEQAAAYRAVVAAM
jgi:predicted nucleotidyltransferase component of viral defense system